MGGSVEVHLGSSFCFAVRKQNKTEGASSKVGRGRVGQKVVVSSSKGVGFCLW